MRIKWNNKGFYDLRREPGVVQDLERRARAVKEAAGEGYEVGSIQGARNPQGRWRTSVITADYKSQKDNAKNDTLLRALDRGRM